MIPLPVIALPPLVGGDQDDRIIDVTVEMPSGPIQVRIDEPSIPFVDQSKFLGPSYVKTWDDYVGQEPLKALLRMHIEACDHLMTPFPHTLLQSGQPGIGKTTLAQLVAQELGVDFKKTSPPFGRDTFAEAARSMPDYGVLFIDEIHILGRMAERLMLHVMEEHVLYDDRGAHKLADFTIIAATTDAGKLPPAVIDRFTLTPKSGAYFQTYSDKELIRITKNFADYFDVELAPKVLVAIALACRRSPRAARDLVMHARALQVQLGRLCTAEELLTTVGTQSDGMTHEHIDYVVGLLRFPRRVKQADGSEKTEYIAGEFTMLTLLMQNKPGLAEIERFLIKMNLIDRTPSGRRLTALGIAKGREYIARGLVRR